MVKAVIFDFDGVIVDTELPVYESWYNLYRSFGLRLTKAKWRQTIGTRGGFDPIADINRSLTEMKEALGQKDPIKVATDNDYQRVQVDIRNRLSKPLSTVAGVSEWIEQAEELKLKIGIASSSPMEWLNKYLESLRLKDRFETVVGTSDKIRPKPFSDVYLIACERLHVSPDEALAVEDSKNGLVAAKNAKLITVVVPSVLTSGDDFSLADIEISSFQELKLTEIIEILEQRNY